MFKKEVILLGLLLLVRIVLSIMQVLIDYKLLLGKYSVNFMELSDLFSYPLCHSMSLCLLLPFSSLYRE